MASSTRKSPWNRKAHRLLGILLIAPLLLVCLTGMALNHGIDLNLSDRKISADWIRSHYGMLLEGEPLAYGLEGVSYAALWDGKIFYRSSIIADSSQLVGAVPLRDGTAVVTASAVHYFGLDGELMETMGPPTLPSPPIIRAGRNLNLELILETTTGIFVSDKELIEFTPATTEKDIVWSVPVTSTKQNIATWKTAFSGDGVPLDRIILDIHSGRFFGSIGKWIYDVLAIGVLILSFTGAILYLRTRRRASIR